MGLTLNEKDIIKYEKELIEHLKQLPVKVRAEVIESENCVVYCGIRNKFFVKHRLIKELFKTKGLKNYHDFLSYLKEKGWKMAVLYLIKERKTARYYTLPPTLQVYFEEKIQKRKVNCDSFIETILNFKFDKVQDLQANSLSEMIDLSKENKLFWVDTEEKTIYLRIKKLANFWGLNSKTVLSKLREKAKEKNMHFINEIFLQVIDKKETDGDILKPDSFLRVLLVKIPWQQ